MDAVSAAKRPTDLAEAGGGTSAPPATASADDAAELAFHSALASLSNDTAQRLIASFLESRKEEVGPSEGVGAPTQANAPPPTTPAKINKGAASKAAKPGLQRTLSSPLPVTGHSRLGEQPYDKDDVREPHAINPTLLSKPAPIFHGERSEKLREAADLHDFPLRVVFDGLTSGLEASTKFKVNVGQVLGGRYRVLQYLGSGTFCHTVQCEDMRAKSNDQHRFVCVKISKNTKDIFDQNLWEVKLLKMLHERMGNDQEASGQLPALLDVFYFRETLFVVYELLRDNLYHIYKYIGEKQLPMYFTPTRCREVARQVLLTLKALHAHGVIHADLKPENILIESLAACKVRVIDYGNAYLVGDERCSYVQSRAYRAPEVVLGVDYSPKVDLWSLGCILMELATGKLLFDNRSVQALLASHIALRGTMPSSVLKRGKLTRHYFASGAKSPFGDRPNLFVKESDGGVCRLTPHRGASIERVLQQHGIDDQQFASFVCDLLTLDPELRPSALGALEHPWLSQSVPGAVEPYLVDARFGASSPSEATRLALRYPSLRDEEPAAEAPDSITDRPIFDGLASRQSAPASLRNSQRHTGSLRGSARLSEGSIEDEMHGPLTPVEFRSKSYAEREEQAKGRPPHARSKRRGSAPGLKDLKKLLGVSDKGKGGEASKSTSGKPSSRRSDRP